MRPRPYLMGFARRAADRWPSAKDRRMDPIAMERRDPARLDSSGSSTECGSRNPPGPLYPAYRTALTCNLPLDYTPGETLKEIPRILQGTPSPPLHTSMSSML